VDPCGSDGGDRSPAGRYFEGDDAPASPRADRRHPRLCPAGGSAAGPAELVGDPGDARPGVCPERGARRGPRRRAGRRGSLRGRGGGAQRVPRRRRVPRRAAGPVAPRFQRWFGAGVLRAEAAAAAGLARRGVAERADGRVGGRGHVVARAPAGRVDAAIRAASRLPADVQPRLRRAGAVWLREWDVVFELVGLAETREGRTPAERAAIGLVRAEAVRRFLVEQAHVSPAQLEVRPARPEDRPHHDAMVGTRGRYAPGGRPAGDPSCAAVAGERVVVAVARRNDSPASPTNSSARRPTPEYPRSAGPVVSPSLPTATANAICNLQPATDHGATRPNHILSGRLLLPVPPATFLKGWTGEAACPSRAPQLLQVQQRSHSKYSLSRLFAVSISVLSSSF
jgi:hypothetical protein